MSLNFPVDTSQPYIDPSSGLKYVFNGAVGAWESAIQPPAIISAYPPTDITIPGFLYWDQSDGNLYIYYIDDNGDGQWVQTSPNAELPKTFITPAAPPDPNVGDLWWDPNVGRLFVYYEDADSTQWVDASPGNLQDQSAPVVMGADAPGNPLVGALWWNTTDGNMYVWYEDPDGGSFWVSASSNLGIVTEAKVSAIGGTLPIEITGTLELPVVNIRYATNTTAGSIRLATQVEANTKLSSTVALTPSVLNSAIRFYVPEATTEILGVLETATQQEVDAGVATNKIVTPATLANSSFLQGVPPGAVVEWFRPTIPNGWIPCDGRSAAPYPNLVSLGFTNVPDLRGEFTRGWDNGRGIDTGRVLGSFQGQSFETHQHIALSSQIGSWAYNGVWVGDRPQNNIYCVLPYSIVANPNMVNANTTAPITGSAGSETRPRNVACIKIMKT